MDDCFDILLAQKWEIWQQNKQWEKHPSIGPEFWLQSNTAHKNKKSTMSHPDHSISLVLGLPNASVFLNLSRPSFPQRMQVVLHTREQLSVKIISLAHNAFLLGTVCYHAVIMAGQCAK